MVSYYVIVASGEDIFQGAGTEPDVFGDAIAAFNHSVRLADMFAWAVINFFDYTFSFGPDLWLRLMDVLAALSIFYMATYIALKRRPRFQVLDAATFAGIFLLVFLTSNGLTLYAGFSKIHNYLFITFFSLLFGIFYLRDLWGRKTLETWWFAGAMLILGFLFGFASNVTAIVFLLAVVIYGIHDFIRERAGFAARLKKFVFSWRFMGVIGILLSVALMYLVGSGLGDYETNPAYRVVCDYLPIGEIFDDIGLSIQKIFSHNVYNFGRFLLPFVVTLIPVAVYAVVKHWRSDFRKLKADANYLAAAGIFIFMHIFAMSQIIYPTRLVLPAYMFAAAVFFYVLRIIFEKSREKVKLKTWVLVLIVVLMSGVTALRTYFAVSYTVRIAPILEEIRTTEAESYCVDLKTATAESLPYIHLGQEDFLVDWAMPQTIYGKRIEYCE